MVVFCVTPVTLEPITELIVTVPEPLPELVTVPPLFMLPVWKVIPPVLLAFIVKANAAVIAPLNVAFPLPLLPMVAALPKVMAPL